MKSVNSDDETSDHQVLKLIYTSGVKTRDIKDTILILVQSLPFSAIGCFL